MVSPSPLALHSLFLRLLSRQGTAIINLGVMLLGWVSKLVKSTETIPKRHVPPFITIPL